MDISLDIAGILAAVMWPIVILVGLLVFRRNLPELGRQVADRVTKLEVVGISLDLAQAKAFAPEWTGGPGAIDLRHQAASIQINDSTQGAFIAQIGESGPADYAVVNLGTGKEWLTSRLFIIAIIFAQVKGVRAFVFLETAQGVRRRFVGWAEPDRIRWALAKRCPWLEKAYAGAYSNAIEAGNTVVISDEGRLGFPWDPSSLNPSIDLMRDFLGRIQETRNEPPTPSEPTDWIQVDQTSNTYEHAQWLDGQQAEDMLAGVLHDSTLRQNEVISQGAAEQVRSVLAMPDKFIALISDDHRFQGLIERGTILNQAAQQLTRLK